MFQTKKRVVNKSKGVLCPSLTSDCKITLCVEPFDPALGEFFSICLNSQSEFSCANPAKYYDSVLAECVRTMKEGELSHFDVTISATDSADKPEMLKLMLQLHSFTQGKEVCDMSCDVKIDFAERWKKVGNSFFSNNEICMAGYWYSKALFLLISCGTDDIMSPLKEKYNDLLCSSRLNLAAVQLKRKLHNHVITNCTKALTLDQSLVKALYRRAQAYVAEGENSLALKDLKLALKVEPKSGAIRKLLKEINAENIGVEESISSGT